MKIHEYQARQLLADAHIPVPDAIVVDSPDQAQTAYKTLVANGAPFCVVKAQVHAGGRGKAGGVRLVHSPEQAQQAAQQILDNPLITHQTTPQGITVTKLMIAAAVDIDKEFYLAITLDRANNAPTLIASAQGGTEIEIIAKDNPLAIISTPLHPLLSLQPYQARQIAFKLGFIGKQISQAAEIMLTLAKLYISNDADLIEINPLVTTKPNTAHHDSQVIAIDAKMTFDDNALFRHPTLQQMHDPSEEYAPELRAKQFDLNYIKLDGNIGCLVNGAGLAMATMDIIKIHGSEPANFLDVGGSATEQAVTQAFSIILADTHVKGVLVNIFGGIMQCDKIARAIVNAAQQIGFKVPLVVRLEGTNVDQARQILDNAHAQIPMLQTASDLADAAQKVTAAVKPA